MNWWKLVAEIAFLNWAQKSVPFCSCPSSSSDQLVETPSQASSSAQDITVGSHLKLTVSGYTSQALHREKNASNKLRKTPQIKLFSQINTLNFLSMFIVWSQSSLLVRCTTMFVYINSNYFIFESTFERQLICASKHSKTVLPGTNHSFTKNI